MSTRHRRLAAGGLLLAAALAGGVATWLVAAGGGGGPGAQPAAGATGGRWTIEDARNFTKFPLYWLGESYKGLRLYMIGRVEWYPPASAKVGYPQDEVVFLYDDGRCTRPTPPPAWEEFSCPVPLGVSVGRACLKPPGATVPRGDLSRLRVDRGALVYPESDGHFVAWTGDVVVAVTTRPDVVASAEEVFRDLVAVDPAGPRAGEPLPAGPLPSDVRYVDFDAIVKAKGEGACGGGGPGAQPAAGATGAAPGFAPPPGPVQVMPPIVSPDELRRCLNSPANPYPPVVAVVNGDIIAGWRLAVAVECSRLTPQADGLAEAERVSRMLDALIEEQLLVQEARRLGLEATEAEGRAMLESVKAGAAAAPFDETMLAMWQAFMDRGDDALAQDYARFQSASNAWSHIASEVPPAERGNPEAVRNHVKARIAELRAAARVETFLASQP